MSSLSTTIKFPLINESYVQPTGLFINNEYVAAKSGKTFKVISPINEEQIAVVQQADDKDVDVAVAAASKAFQTWKFTKPEVRARLIYKVADLIEQKKDLLAKIEALDNGKSLVCAQWDLNLVIQYLRSVAGYADKADGRTISTGADYLTYTKREPLGVCGAITPWNFPLLMFAWKVGPCLATGNTIVLKPASATPLSNLFAAQLFKEAGFPAGVINVVPGSGRTCGGAILHHPKIKKVAFTGSTVVGKGVMRDASESVKKVTLELGGKSPNIVFQDADVEKTVQNLITGIFFNGGEVCCAGSRIYVQATDEKWYNSFLAKFKEETEKLKVGNPFAEGVFQGAQTNPEQFQTVLDYLKIAKDTNLKVLTGGHRIGNKGFFIEPTVFYDVPQDSQLTREEIFGPVAVLLPFKTIDEVIEKANESEYGLAAAVQTEDINKALYVADRLEAGSVWINTYNDLQQNSPFGGYKESGIGREMGLEALDNYTQVKLVRVKIVKPEL
ncbi:DEKNAAC103915 [Brettanomyces naardenensis]|uniref:Aldehyde dehydrogenase 5, mitochondrial n=1 Tax=Brettanomyces naardenensis TaxID=13370 RepID=A0A448YPG0_BRENA|nr:DEKNAAC103915 [Brettanomyces naardenensis]